MWDFTLPWVLGAEFAGTVTEVGGHVTSVGTGDLVTALLQYGCETCERCQAHRCLERQQGQQCPLNALVSQLGRMTPGAQAVVAPADERVAGPDRRGGAEHAGGG